VGGLSTVIENLFIRLKLCIVLQLLLRDSASGVNVSVLPKISLNLGNQKQE
jgi:hypothetical protein